MKRIFVIMFILISLNLFSQTENVVIPEIEVNAVNLNEKNTTIDSLKKEYEEKIKSLNEKIIVIEEKIAPKKEEPKKEEKIVKKEYKPVSTIFDRVRSFFGIFLLLGITVLLSFNKKEILKYSKRAIIGGLTIQFVFAIFVMKVPYVSTIFKAIGDGVNKLLEFTHDGSKFVFGDLFNQWSFALKVLPVIIFFSAFMGILYHLGIMQLVVKFIAKGMAKALNTSGAESLSATANIFVGQTEAPLVVKPFIKNMTNSEITAIMIGGFATVAGGVLAAFIGMGIDATALIAASVMAAPGSLVIAKIIYPENQIPVTRGVVEMDNKNRETANVIDAAARGASDGLSLALNVAAMLIAFIAIIYGINYGLKEISSLFMNSPLSLEKLFGYLFSPVAYMMGVEWKDALYIGQLLGEKIVINEFYAYSDLANNVTHVISDRSNIIAAFALVGFANFSSIAIQIGGIGAMAPERKSDLAKIGLRAMLGGTIVALINGSIAGLLM